MIGDEPNNKCIRNRFEYPALNSGLRRFQADSPVSVNSNIHETGLEFDVSFCYIIYINLIYIIIYIIYFLH